MKREHKCYDEINVITCSHDNYAEPTVLTIINYCKHLPTGTKREVIVQLSLSHDEMVKKEMCTERNQLLSNHGFYWVFSLIYSTSLNKNQVRMINDMTQFLL